MGEGRPLSFSVVLIHSVMNAALAYPVLTPEGRRKCDVYGGPAAGAVCSGCAEDAESSSFKFSEALRHFQSSIVPFG
jgi:hypothetical protein